MRNETASQFSLGLPVYFKFKILFYTFTKTLGQRFDIFSSPLSQIYYPHKSLLLFKQSSCFSDSLRISLIIYYLPSLMCPIINLWLYCNSCYIPQFTTYLPKSCLPLTSWAQIRSDQISRWVVSNSLRPQESQHARPPCPSPTPGVHSDSRPSSQWCHPAISSSVVPFSSCPQSFVPSHALLKNKKHLNIPFQSTQARRGKDKSELQSLTPSSQVHACGTKRGSWGRASILSVMPNTAPNSWVIFHCVYVP